MCGIVTPICWAISLKRGTGGNELRSTFGFPTEGLVTRGGTRTAWGPVACEATKTGMVKARTKTRILDAETFAGYRDMESYSSAWRFCVEQIARENSRRKMNPATI